jgi:stage IV sporulation protein A
MNSANPSSERSIALAYELEEKYGAPVALVSCLELDAEDIRHILELVLHEFPITEVSVQLPEWTEALDSTHRIKSSVLSSVKSCLDSVGKIGEIKNAFKRLADNEYVKNVSLDSVSLGNGKASLTVNLSDGLYYSVISELTGFDIAGERELISLMSELAEMKTQYDKVSEALASANEKGYGIVMPSITDLRLEEPEIVKQSGGYGVRLRASAQSIHMIRANIETEINPIVGTQEQSADFVKYMLNEFEEDPQRIWESNMFGKSLYELVNEGLHTKLEHMPEESRTKLSETLERIINEGSGGLICIIL